MIINNREFDPTIADWAKNSTKPSYTAAEVGAAVSSHTHNEYTTKNYVDEVVGAHTTGYMITNTINYPASSHSSECAYSQTFDFSNLNFNIYSCKITMTGTLSASKTENGIAKGYGSVNLNINEFQLIAGSGEKTIASGSFNASGRTISYNCYATLSINNTLSFRIRIYENIGNEQLAVKSATCPITLKLFA